MSVQKLRPNQGAASNLMKYPSESRFVKQVLLEIGYFLASLEDFLTEPLLSWAI